MDKACEVLDRAFIAHRGSAVVEHPGKETFDLPSAFVASQRTPILGDAPFGSSMRRNELNMIAPEEHPIQWVGIITPVGNEPFGS